MMTGWMIYGGFVFIAMILLFNEAVKDEGSYWLKVNGALVVLMAIGFVYDSLNNQFYGMYLLSLLVALNTAGFMVQLAKKSGRKALLQVLYRLQIRLESNH